MIFKPDLNSLVEYDAITTPNQTNVKEGGMIPKPTGTAMPAQVTLPDWRQAMAQTITDPEELLAILGLNDRKLIAAARQAAALFPLRVPRSYVSRMQRGDPDDPLLRQVLPIAAEQHNPPGYMSDPVGDLHAMVTPGLLHKYQGRALLVTTGACAIHCRYCFRREFPYSLANPKKDGWAAALRHIADDSSIEELILSGGDPLTLSNKVLKELLVSIAGITHIKRVRFHSRLAVVLPERIDNELIAILANYTLPVIQVIHTNHAREIDGSVRDSLAKLRSVSSALLNQTVLLKGINDDMPAQIELANALIDSGVLPYYLHMLDPVNGASHFDVDEKSAISLIEGMKNRLPGYMVPRLVREIAGRPSKTQLFDFP